MCITSVLLKDGTQYASVPSPQEFQGLENRWYEVKALIEAADTEHPEILKSDWYKEMIKYLDEINI